MGKRRQSRELVLQALYQADFHNFEAETTLREFWRTRSIDDADIGFQRLDPETVGFAKFLFDGVMARLAEIDGIIEKHSQHWRLGRMNRIDRNILRLGVFELLTLEDVPTKVVIDEAIEIGKKYGSGDSGAFINGILDPIAKKMGR